MLSKLIDNDAGIAEVNRLAETLSQMPQKQLTDYGVVERKDRQPVRVPEEQPQQGGMEMMW